jgi:hypothetical protein
LDGESARAKYSVTVVLAGLAVVLVAFGIAVLKFGAADVSTALAPVTGVVGTIVGAYFGVQAGASGKETTERSADARVAQADQARQAAERDAKALVAVAPAELATRVLGMDVFNESDRPGSDSVPPDDPQSGPGRISVT